MSEWEVRITVLRDGEEVMHSDALGDDPATALYFAHNDLELELSVMKDVTP